MPKPEWQKMEFIPDWVWNSNAQSLFLSPLVGAIMGVLLTLVFSPTEQSSNKVPSDSSVGKQTSRVSIDDSINVDRSFNNVNNSYNKYYNINNYGSQKTSSDDMGSVLAISGAALIFTVVLCFLYLRYANLAIQVLLFLSSMLCVFSLSYIVIGYATGWLSGKDWLLRLSLPLVLGLLSFLLLGEAKIRAEYYFQNGSSLTLGQIIRSIDQRWVAYVILQALGILVLGLSILIGFAASIYYSSLGGIVSKVKISGFRKSMINLTKTFSGWGGLITAALMISVAWFLISGTAFRLFNL